jgi:hypothetical protein
MCKRVVVALAVLLSSTAATIAGFRVETFEETFSFEGPDDQVIQRDAEYQCEARDAVAVQPDGTVGHQLGVFNLWIDEMPLRFRFDTTTGVMSLVTKDVQWEVLQLGSNYREFIAHDPSRDPLNNLLRIDTYAEPMTFWLTDGSDVITGVCTLG